MAKVRPFVCIRPREGLESQVAALPYDVYSREEARIEVKGKPLSFLNIDRPETQFAPDADMYCDEVYEKARELLDEQIRAGVYVSDEGAHYYLYELTMDGRSQTGIVGCASIDDYLAGVIKKHENTRREKEFDRIRHVDFTNAHTGPIFLACRSNDRLKALVEKIKSTRPLSDFSCGDGVEHRVWRIDDTMDGESGLTERIGALFEEMPALYIADGHHRAASAVQVGLKRRKQNPEYTGQEEFNYFLSVIFPEEELKILPYNRAVKDLNGLSKEGFLIALKSHFDIERLDEGKTYEPQCKYSYGMYLKGRWYRLSLKKGQIPGDKDPVKRLDVSVLQDLVLEPVLGIVDPRTDERIAFIGGIRGLKELEKKVKEGFAVAFALYPTTIGELLDVADAGLLMPPKSTWFEPKLRSGVFIHRLS